jgi:tetratricopeptide (TPR) repeat protein
MIHFRRFRFAFFLMSLSTIIAVVAPLFLITSCQNLQQTPRELKARETLRSMTRGGVLPADNVVARIENDFPRTTAGSLATIVRARIRLKANDYVGAAALLDSRNFADYTTIPDHVLWMRGNALEQAGSRVEARAVYEKLAREYPNSLRARDALIRVAQILLQDGQTASAPTMLKTLHARDDATALLLTARAYEQTGDSTRALGSYRRLYFFAPASAEAGEAASAIARLGSSTAPASAEEAKSRAEKLFAAKRYSDAYDAYTSLFLGSPTSATSELAARRVLAAANAR